MGLKADLLSVIKDAVPYQIAEHDRDGFDKLHDGDLLLLVNNLAKYVKKHYRKK